MTDTWVSVVSGVVLIGLTTVLTTLTTARSARLRAEDDAYVRAKEVWDAALKDLVAERGRLVADRAVLRAENNTLRRHLRQRRDAAVKDLAAERTGLHAENEDLREQLQQKETDTSG